MRRMTAPSDFLDPRDCAGEDDRPPAWRRMSFLPSGLLHPGQRVRWRGASTGETYDMEVVGFALPDVLASLWSVPASPPQMWLRYIHVNPELWFQVDADQVSVEVLAEHTDADEGRTP